MRNETDQILTVSYAVESDRDASQSNQTVGAGSSASYVVNTCLYDVSVQTWIGDEAVAEIDQLCEDDIWTITAAGQAVLTHR